MAAGLPKDPIEPVRSTDVSLTSPLFGIRRGTPRQGRSPSPLKDASLGTVIGGFSLRGGARSIGI